MPRRLTHCRLGLLRQLVHARCPRIVADLALRTASLLGAKLNDQSLALLRDLHAVVCGGGGIVAIEGASAYDAVGQSMLLGEGLGRSSLARLSDWRGNQHAIRGGPGGRCFVTCSAK